MPGAIARRLKERRLLTKPSDGKPLPDEVKRLLADYFPEYDLSNIRVYEGLPWYVAIDATAYTDRERIYFRRGAYCPDTIRGVALIGHEVTHVVQYATHGKWTFRKNYLADWARNMAEQKNSLLAYLSVEYEKEARDMESRIFSDLSRATDIEGLSTYE